MSVLCCVVLCCVVLCCVVLCCCILYEINRGPPYKKNEDDEMNLR
jgi:hypothetical protein